MPVNSVGACPSERPCDLALDRPFGEGGERAMRELPDMGVSSDTLAHHI